MYRFAALTNFQAVRSGSAEIPTESTNFKSQTSLSFQSSKRKKRWALAKLTKQHLSLTSLWAMWSIKTSSNLFCNQVQHINLHLFFLKISKMVFILSFKNFQKFFSSIFLGNYTEVERLREKVLLHLLVIVDYCPRIPPKSNEKLLKKLY